MRRHFVEPPERVEHDPRGRARCGPVRRTGGRTPHSVTGARKLDEGGWSVLIDLTELERIPWSSSVMATYRVDLDSSGERLRRFTLGATDPT